MVRPRSKLTNCHSVECASHQSYRGESVGSQLRLTLFFSATFCRVGLRCHLAVKLAVRRVNSILRNINNTQATFRSHSKSRLPPQWLVCTVAPRIGWTIPFAVDFVPDSSSNLAACRVAFTHARDVNIPSLDAGKNVEYVAAVTDQ